jgi:hypothetical protein
MNGVLLITAMMLLGEAPVLPTDVERLQQEVKAVAETLAVKEAELKAKIAAIPEVLGPLERLTFPQYGECEAQRIVQGPILEHVGKYKITRVFTPPGDPYGFIGWLNQTRAAYGLSAVGYDANLSNWAAMNNDQQTARGMGHHVMGPASRQNAAMGAFENIGAMWMNSPAHRAALLDPTITSIGIAGLGAYWTFNAR